ncbi:hypothetical protein SRHO_G00095010 [Serrasalmus rhombeus]
MVFTVQSQLALPDLGHLIVLGPASSPSFRAALLFIGCLCRHGDNSCLWDEEATFGVPASLTACNQRIPKSLMAFKIGTVELPFILYTGEDPSLSCTCCLPSTLALLADPGSL